MPKPFGSFARRALVVAAIGGLALYGLGLPERATSGEVVTVRVLRAKVMKAPRFIGGTVASVSRGQQLNVGSARGSWLQVDSGIGAGGYIHKTNVVKGNVKLNSRPGGGTGRATRDEVELAGRGFTPEVEEKYKKRHGDLDFSHVDAIEKAEVDPVSLGDFVESGKLAFGEGE